MSYIVNSFIEQESLKLTEVIGDRKKIYLDINYWILLRDKDKRTWQEQAIFETLNRLVETKKCVCPISDVVFYEILKQSDTSTRNDTIKIVEKFSSGITIVDIKQRVGIEFRHWLNTLKKVDKQYHLKYLVWSKLTLILGYRFFSEKITTLKTIEEQKAALQFVSSVPILEGITSGIFQIPPFTFKDNVEEFNKNKELYKEQNATFKEMFLSELFGYIDLFCNSFDDVMFSMYEQETGRCPTEDERKAINGAKFRDAIFLGFQNGTIDKELPTLRIFPTLFASFRWNKDRKYKDGNDTMDVLHASCALPYCDFFFTENELCTIIRQHKLDQKYGCVVESKQEKIIELLNLI